VRRLRRMVPSLRSEDLRPGPSGVRAQLVDPSGRLVDDFRFTGAGPMLHVLNAPSPAATASLAIGAHVADRLLEGRSS
jgi:L-2-hydroxyglutarate oxidase